MQRYIAKLFPRDSNHTNPCGHNVAFRRGCNKSATIVATWLGLQCVRVGYTVNWLSTYAGNYNADRPVSGHFVS